VECACALFPANLLVSQNNNISLRGLRKSARRRACALGCSWRCFRYKDIDHILNSEHEYALLRLPRAMAPMYIFPYTFNMLRSSGSLGRVVNSSYILCSTLTQCPPLDPSVPFLRLINYMWLEANAISCFSAKVRSLNSLGTSVWMVPCPSS
jgi:hypothetical protein